MRCSLVVCSIAAGGTAALVSLVSACVDLGGLSGGDARDAGSDASIASDATSVSDAGGPDGSGPIEAGGPFCPQAGKELCVDFDESTAGALANQSLGQGSINFIDKTLVVSVPAGVADWTTVGAAFPISNVQAISCEFDYKRVTEPGSTTDEVSIMRFSAVAPGEGATQVILLETPSGGAIRAETAPADGGAVTTVSTPTPRLAKPAGQWVRARFELSLVDKRLQVFRDGVSLGVISVSAPSPANVKNTVVTLGLSPQNQLNATWTVAFDNLACDF